MIASRSFPRVPRSVPAARRFVGSVITGAPKEVADLVAVMVSELATNAIRHAGTAFEVLVETTGDQICVQIIDTGAGDPVVRHASARDHSGRGLHIVELLSDDWGVRYDEETIGKAVWFNLSLGGSATRKDSGSTIAPPSTAKRPRAQ